MVNFGLLSDDGAIYAKFLPANVTSLIQPMDQGVIQSLKRRYRKRLLQRLIIEDDCGTSIVDFLKGINLKIVIDLVYAAWAEICKDTLRKSWRKIIPIVSICSKIMSQSPQAKASRGYGVWRGLRIRIDHGENAEEVAVTNDVPVDLFQVLGYEMESDEINTRLDSDVGDSGVQVYTDAEICEIVSRSSEPPEDEAYDEEEDEEEECQISNSDAARMFEWGLSWLEHQPEATVYNTSVLRELHALAAKKRMESIKQTKLGKYF